MRTGNGVTACISSFLPSHVACRLKFSLLLLHARIHARKPVNSEYVDCDETQGKMEIYGEKISFFKVCFVSLQGPMRS
jgi:hypothetical protein